MVAVHSLHDCKCWRPKSISQESRKVFVGASLPQSPGAPCTLENRYVCVLEPVRVPVVVWVPSPHTRLDRNTILNIQNTVV